MQDEVEVRAANLAFSACASSAFCFAKSAGAAWARRARARMEKAESLAEIMMMRRGLNLFDRRVLDEDGS